MQMTKLQPNAFAVATGLLLLAALSAVSFVIAPLAIASSASSGYPMEIIRAHTVYKTADPAAVVQIGLGVPGNR